MLVCGLIWKQYIINSLLFSNYCDDAKNMHAWKSKCNELQQIVILEYKAANVPHYSEQQHFGEVTTYDTNDLARCMSPFWKRDRSKESPQPQGSCPCYNLKQESRHIFPIVLV